MTTSFLFLLISYLTLFVGHVFADHTVAKPKGARAIVVTSENTLNATRPPTARLAYTADGSLQISVTNNLDSPNVTAYVTGLDPSGQLVMLQPDGQWFYPTAGLSPIPRIVVGDISIPLGAPGSITNLTLPTYLSSGRIWFADGDLKFFTVPGAAGPALVQPSAANPSDPSASVNWGFIELTNIPQGLYANISYVDFLGLPLGMSLIGASGTQTSLGVSADAVIQLCKLLTARSNEAPVPWDQLCVTDTSGKAIRVLSPALYSSINGTALAKVFNGYVNRVWQRYTKEPLVINTQAGPGKVKCWVKQDVLKCDGDSTTYAKPSSFDIFGCNTGPFAISGSATNLGVVPRLCAAFNRATLLLPRGNVQPQVQSPRYYLSSPRNWYSYFVHTLELDGKGYAFSYDDVTPDNTVDLSGLLADSNPSLMAITVGGPTLNSGDTITTSIPTPTATASTLITRATLIAKVTHI
ncbi:hypothetical protein CAC42_1897 [Sphaceloma murrayae]|uniref:GH64 domain-containing protein n=1 Tax=Sphaceloma murrayae TaxID=2082308 RepID=A0A2K1QVT7_9PEZI|nr:hypothetical protein CAC42_1897 [Sphaceloma murrayae]